MICNNPVLYTDDIGTLAGEIFQAMNGGLYNIMLKRRLIGGRGRPSPLQYSYEYGTAVHVMSKGPL